MDNLEIFDKDGKALHITNVIGNFVSFIHYDLSLTAMQLMKENDTMKVEEFRELPEVKKLWGAMDVLRQYYL